MLLVTLTAALALVPVLFAETPAYAENTALLFRPPLRPLGRLFRKRFGGCET